MEGVDQLIIIALSFYHDQFVSTYRDIFIPLLKHIPNLIFKESNKVINDIPTREKVNKVLFELNRDNASRPIGFTSHFLQT